MAADELLLDQAADSDRTTLRLYRWSQPTLSLGYFQSLDDISENVSPLAVVRRPTGGGAILHDQELTYAVAAPETLADSPGLYAAMNRVIIRAVAALGVTEATSAISSGDRNTQRGPFFCFERSGPTDIIARTRKLAGGAQRKHSGAILQHGSVLLETNQPGAIGLGELIRRAVTFDELTATLVLAFQEEFHATLTPQGFNTEEFYQIEAIRSRRYATSEWLHHGDRKHHVEKIK